MKDRSTDRAVSQPAESVNMELVEQVPREILEVDAIACNGRSALHEDITRRGSVDRSPSQSIPGVTQTNGIGSFWSEMVSRYRGSCRKMSARPAADSVSEFSGGHHGRLPNTVDEMALAVEWMIRGELRYRHLVLANEAASGARSMAV